MKVPPIGHFAQMEQVMTREKRAAIQSVRAKARKGVAVEGITLPKAVLSHFNAVITWADGKLAVTSKKAAAETEEATEEASGELVTA